MNTETNEKCGLCNVINVRVDNLGTVIIIDV